MPHRGSTRWQASPGRSPRLALGSPVVTLVSQTVVDPEDPAFSSPAKFVGSVHTEVEAKELTDEHDWTFARDGDGWRHVVVASRSSRGRMASRASKPSSTKDLASAHVAQQLGADL